MVDMDANGGAGPWGAGKDAQDCLGYRVGEWGQGQLVACQVDLGVTVA